MPNSIEIVKLSDVEFRIQENKIFVPEGNIVFIIVKGIQTKEIGQTHLAFHNDLMSLRTGKIKYLIDLNQAGKSAPEARAIWQQLSEMDTTDKVALFGMHPVARVLASFVMGMMNNAEIRFFDKKYKAEEWLNQ